MSTIGLLLNTKEQNKAKKINLYLLLIFLFFNHSLLNQSRLDLYCKLNILTYSFRGKIPPYKSGFHSDMMVELQETPPLSCMPKKNYKVPTPSWCWIPSFLLLYENPLKRPEFVALHPPWHQYLITKNTKSLSNLFLHLKKKSQESQLSASGKTPAWIADPQETC